MADRSWVTRLRTDGGPSHDLLVLLDQHRVLSSTQLARLTGTAQRTVTHRLDRLLTEKLVANTRPGREAGSSPRLWWLTPAGARLVSGVTPAEGRQPSAMFAAHASAIAEVWLAVLEHGPAVGLTPRRWWPDRAGWQMWRPRDGEQTTLSPDAILLAELPAGETVAMVEVDLATMTQTRLRAKVKRYLAYAEDRQWADRWPHCPPLLLLTTTEARARTFIAAAALTAAAHRRGRGLDYRWRGYPGAAAEVAAAEQLVIAACGLVRSPAAAVTDAVWLRAGDEPDDGGDGEPAGVRLVDLLAERMAAQQVADGWYARRAADVARAVAAQLLRDVADDDVLAGLLGERPAGAYRHLLGRGGAAFTEQHPQLAEQVRAWWDGRGQPGDDDRRRDLSAELSAVHERLLAGQIRRLLACRAAAHGRPRAAVVAAALQAGQLVSEVTLEFLEKPNERADQLQQRLLAGHAADRQAAVDAQLQELGWWARRSADPAQLAAAYDAARLLICPVCTLVVPRRDEQIYDDEDNPCPHCSNRLIGYADRDQVPTLADRLAQLRTRLPG